MQWIEDHPVETSLLVISAGLLLYSLTTICLTIFPPVGFVPVLSAGLPEWGMYAACAYFSFSSIPGLIAPFNHHVPNVWLEWAAFSMFMSYLFLSIIRVMAYGWFPLTWFGLIVVSLCSGALRLYLRSHRHE